MGYPADTQIRSIYAPKPPFTEFRVSKKEIAPAEDIIWFAGHIGNILLVFTTILNVRRVKKKVKIPNANAFGIFRKDVAKKDAALTREEKPKKQP